MSWTPLAKRRFFLGVALLYATENLWTTFLLWQVLSLSHSPTWVAAAAAAGVAPTVLVGITGPHWGIRGRLGLWLVLVGGLILALTPALAGSAGGLLALTLAQDWVLAGAIPLSQAALMAHAGGEDAARSSSYYEMASRTGIVLGPLLCGLLLTAAGPQAAMGAVGVGFFAAFALWRGLSVAASEPPSERRPAANGWRAMRRDPFLTLALTVRAGSNLVWPAFTVGIPLLIRTTWHAHAIGYGGIRTLWGVGTVVGTLVIVPRLLDRLRWAYFVSWMSTGLAFLAIGLTSGLTGALVWTAVGSLSSPLVHVALDSHIGTAILPAARSAVYAIQRLVMAAVNLVGLALMSTALRWANAGQTLSGAGIIMILLAAVGLVWWRRLRSVEEYQRPLTRA